VNDILSLFEIVTSAAMVAASAVLLVRVLAGSEGGTLADLFAVYADPPWPRGVQEEEPTRWRVDLLRGPSNTGDRPLDVAKDRSMGQPAAVGLEARQRG
jgi:hypothetical protein